MKDYVLLKNETCPEKPYHIEPSAKYQARPPANSRYRFLGDFSTIGEAVAAMRKDAGADPKEDTALGHAFSVMNLGITPGQRAAFNDFRLQLYLSCDKIRDRCRMMPEFDTREVNHLMDLICKIPCLGR
jgi:hypothetical protein